MSGIPKGKFPKSAHLLKHADFQRVYKQGKRHFSANMTFFYVSTPSGVSSSLGEDATEFSKRAGGEPIRFGFTVPRALGGAVDRNRIRRRVWEAVRRHMNELQGLPTIDVVINPKRTARDIEFAALSVEVGHAFQVICRNARKAQIETGRHTLLAKDPQWRL